MPTRIARSPPVPGAEIARFPSERPDVCQDLRTWWPGHRRASALRFPRSLSSQISIAARPTISRIVASHSHCRQVISGVDVRSRCGWVGGTY